MNLKFMDYKLSPDNIKNLKWQIIKTKSQEIN
jgi:hypothetical protein